ncbi:MAG: glycoside hydrolase family 28 protein [Paludibacteraceae bacterium]|nr:glycoside hydrolase family 28 protein [Paludibacteraceae bacterium]
MRNTLLTIFSFVSACLLTGCTDRYQSITQKVSDDLITTAEFTMPSVTLPTFPSRTLSIIDCGADPTGQTLSTVAIQTAIDSLAQQGGGTVLFPKGVFYTGPISLRSHIRLYTEENCVVLFSPDYQLYPQFETAFEGVNTHRCQSPISAFQAEDIAITGHGVFNGNGDYWRPLKRSKVTDSQWKKQLEKGGVLTEDGKTWYPDEGALFGATLCQDQNVPVVDSDSVWAYIHTFLRPVMVHLVGCKNILLEGVTFENSPAWNLHPLMCENVTLNRLTVRNPWYSQNGDGVDVESCKNVLINECSFDVGDDAICMKSGKNEDGRRRAMPTKNVFVNNCTVYHGHGGFVVGSEMSGDVRNIQVQNCTFLGTDVGLRFKSTRGRGGVVENIYIRDIYMWAIPNEALLFDLFYGGKGAGEETEEEIMARMNAAAPEVDETTPAFRHIFIHDVIAKDAASAMLFNGLPEMPLEDVNLSNITMSCTRGAIIRQTNGLRISNVQLTATQGEAWTIAPSVTNITKD